MAKNNEERRINSNVVIVIAAVIVTLLILAIIWIKLHEGGEEDPIRNDPKKPPVETVVVTEKEHHSYSGMTDLTIKSGAGRKATLEFMNTEKNDCVQVLTVQDKDGNELYKSEYISAGQYLNEVELNRDFEPGTYDVQIFVRSYKNDADHQQLSGVGYQKKLIVEK